MATVLIVEDEDVLRETLSSFLTRQGHDVIAAASGYEALEVGLDASPDVLVADWMLKNHIHGLHVSAVFRALHPQPEHHPDHRLPLPRSARGVGSLRDRASAREALRPAGSRRGRLERARAPEPREPISRRGSQPIAVDPSGRIQFASLRAQQLFAASKLASRRRSSSPK